MIAPGLRWAWRDGATVQFGIDVPEPVLVTGMPALARVLLPLLDGERTLADVVKDAIGALPEATRDDVVALIAQLERFGVLLDGGNWPPRAHLTASARERLTPDVMAATARSDTRQLSCDRLLRLRSTRVSIVGLSRLGATIWSLLAASGVGKVDALDQRRVETGDVSVGGFSPEDVGRVRSELPAIRQAWSSGSPPRQTARHLVVVTDAVDIDEECRRLMRRQMTHLIVRCRQVTGWIGPLVQPGSTSCWNCMMLSRRDLDPAWPQLWRQSPMESSPQNDSVVVGLTAHLAAQQILEWLIEGAPEPGVVTEVSAPDVSTSQVHYSPHPECGCRWPAAA